VNRLETDTRGAVYLEFLIAFLPVVTFFFATWQFTELCAADLVLRRAASAAARAATVVLTDDPHFYGGQAVNAYDGDRRRDIEMAAAMILSASPHFSTFKVDIQGKKEPGEEMIAVVSASFRCGGGWVSLVCGGGASRMLTARASVAYQGAKYRYE
jgi:hypothetical protein